MARRDQLQVLREVSDLRAIQRAAAEGDLAKARARLSAIESRRDDHLARLEDDQHQWAKSLASKAFSLELNGAWRDAIHRTQAQLRDIGAELLDGQAGCATARKALQGSLASEEAARALLTRARREARRRRDETALDEAADRTAQVWVRS